MLRITSNGAGDRIVLKLEGCLAGPWVAELESHWRRDVPANSDGRLQVDVTDVCHVDEAGRRLLTLMYHAGARFVTAGCAMPELVREIARSARSFHRVPRRS